VRIRPYAALAALPVAPAAVPAHAAAPASFAFAARAIGNAAAPVERTYAVPAGALLAGVTWRAGDAAVYVRRGTGAWEQLENDPGEATPAARPGTEPFWLGRSLAPLSIRVVPRTTVSGVEVDFVGGGDSKPSAATSTQTRGLPRLGNVVTRAGWGADESLRRGTPAYTTPTAMVVHHTVTANDYSQADAASFVRAVYTYHTRSRGWSDIGYNLLVDRFGTVYEGRAGDFARGVVGSHTAGFNNGTISLSLLGNYDTVQPPAALVAAMVRAGAWASERWHFDPRGTVTLTSRGSDRFPAGSKVTVSRMPGHRDLGRTACPGRYAYGLLPTVRTEAWRAFRAVFSPPVVEGAPVRSPQPVTITATLDHTASWTATILDSDGNPVVTTTGRGRTARVSWDGTTTYGLPAMPGTTYRYRLDANDGVHGPSDPVSGTFDVGLPAIVG
jgi:hypothetical protein